MIAKISVLLRFGLPSNCFIGADIEPIITAALSQTANPEVALAGYQVATSFSFIFISYIQHLPG